jgi:PHP family Zn ribbon phosphoesterase
MGISRLSSEKDVRKHYVLEKEITLIRNSDAHCLQQIGEFYTSFHLKKICFPEIKSALNQKDGRFVKIP